MSKPDWQDGFLLMRLWLALIVMDVRLRLLRHGLNRRFLFPHMTKDEQTRPQLDAKTEAAIERLSRLVSKAARLHGPFNLSCLRQALVLRASLRALGVPSRLIYGVKKEKSNFSAHAWLEAGGKTINSIPDINPLN
jgi:hypothetical protein